MIRMGVICPSEIAFRRFMPALLKAEDFKFIGLGVYTEDERFGKKKMNKDMVESVMKNEYEKAYKFIDTYGGKIIEGYENIACNEEIDALYIPLPPALHYHWAKVALEHGKHVLLEKPSTTVAKYSKSLVELAEGEQLALYENYMFVFHEQLDAINKIIADGEIGDVRLYSIKFGFPMRVGEDFRYKKELGGGALMDAGGYVIKYATMLLGKSAHLVCANMNYIDKFEVDMFGSATMVNDYGVTAQLAFGMDNDYKCELEVWGSKGCLTAGRIMTAPVGYKPSVTICKRGGCETRELPDDDSFLKSIMRFKECIEHNNIRRDSYNLLVRQAEQIEEFKRLAER